MDGPIYLMISWGKLGLGLGGSRIFSGSGSGCGLS